MTSFFSITTIVSFDFILIQNDFDEMIESDSKSQKSLIQVKTKCSEFLQGRCNKQEKHWGVSSETK